MASPGLPVALMADGINISAHHVEKVCVRLQSCNCVKYDVVSITAFFWGSSGPFIA